MAQNTPIIYTITNGTEKNVRVYTKDARVTENNRDVTFDRDLLFTMLEFITGTLNRQGFAVLFEAD